MHDYQRFCWLYAVPGPVCIVQAHVLIGREDAERASCDWSVETDSLPEIHPALSLPVSGIGGLLTISNNPDKLYQNSLEKFRLHT